MPQGSVIGPLLFLMYIEDLGLPDTANNELNEKAATKILKFVDDSKLLKEINSIEDVEHLQDDLDVIYRWADDNHMRWNAQKFQMLRFGPGEVRFNTNIFAPHMEDVIESKEVVRDLGILIDDSMCYTSHIKKVISKVNNMTSWALRTFHGREIFLMKKIWKTIIQCHIDYGCILWYPLGRKGDMRALEDPLRAFTKRVKGLWNKSYHERLDIMKISSIERRVERYMLLYIWKSVNDYVPSIGLQWNQKTQGRTGQTLLVEPIKGKVMSIKTLKANSMKQHGAVMFNSLPNELKIFKGTVSQFKSKLDSFLSLFPDIPHMDSSHFGATTFEGDPSNSLVDWIRCLDVEWSLDAVKPQSQGVFVY